MPDAAPTAESTMGMAAIRPKRSTLVGGRSGGRLRVIAVCFYNRVGELAARLRHFTVLGGLDRENWCVLFRKSDDQVFGREPLAPLMIVPESQRAVRFVHTARRRELSALR
jgi:hypothetical protein